jgi:hypothetical protein
MSIENTEPVEEIITEQSSETPEFVVSESKSDPIVTDIFSAPIETQVIPQEEVTPIKTPITEVPKEESIVSPIEYDDAKVFEILKQKGIEVSDYESLKPKEVKQLSPEAEKWQEFIDKTGNTNFSDFLETQKDWNTETPENILMQKLKVDYPTLSQEDRELLFENKYGYDEELADEKEVKLKELSKKVDAQEALKGLLKIQEDYKINRGSNDNIPEEYRNAKATIDVLQQQQQEREIAFTQSRQDFVSKTENIFTDKFEGFKIKFGNEKTGFEEITVKPENILETKADQLDLSNFNKKHFDEKTGNLVDADRFHKELYVARNLEKYTEHVWNTAVAKYVEAQDKLSKNIQSENVRQISNNPNVGFTVSESKT